MKKIVFLTMLSGPWLLSGCTHFQEDFDCPVGKGLGCQSITEVKKKLNQQEIDLPETTTEAYKRQGGSLGNVLPVLSTTPSKGSLVPTSFVDASGMMIQRTPEKPLRVWIAPYQDGGGNFHEGAVVHTVIQGGYWHVSPL